MKRLFIGLICMAVILVTACSNSKVSNTNNESGSTDNSIKIGAWIPLTGPIAINGIPQQIGMDAYYKMVNDKGGINKRKINWVVEDNAYDPQKTVAAARKLVERDKVLAIVGANGTANTAATFSYLLDQSKVPIFGVQGGLQEWWNPVKSNLYGVQVVFENQAQALGRWAAKEGAKNILVVHNDPAAFVSVANNVAPGAKSFNPSVNVKLLPVKLGTTDYAPVALQASNIKPDAVVMILPAAEVVAAAKALERQNIKVPLYTYSPNVSTDILKLGGKAVEGLRAMSWTVPPTADTPAVKEYRDALKKYEPKAQPDFQSLFTWAEAKIFAEAVKRVDGPVTREKLTKSLESMKGYETGILPPVTFSSTNHLGAQELQPVKVENGDWSLVGKFIDPTKAW